MINIQSKGNIEIELSENGGFIIKVSTQEIIPVGEVQIKPVMNASRTRQQLFTATTMDEAMIVVREQLEKMMGLI
jgi:hypothetical protein